MTTEKHGPIEVEKAKVPSSPGQATRDKADSTTPNKSTGADSPFLIDSTYKIDAESSNVESEPQKPFFTYYGCSQTPIKVPKKGPSSPALSLQQDCQFVRARSLMIIGSLQ